MEKYIFYSIEWQSHYLEQQLICLTDDSWFDRCGAMQGAWDVAGNHQQWHAIRALCTALPDMFMPSLNKSFNVHGKWLAPKEMLLQSLLRTATFCHAVCLGQLVSSLGWGNSVFLARMRRFFLTSETWDILCLVYSRLCIKKYNI